MKQNVLCALLEFKGIALVSERFKVTGFPERTSFEISVGTSIFV
jgi:hypothetical protein